MKCSNCGSTKLFQVHLNGPTDDGWWHCDDFIPFVCEECGHVEFYASKEIVDNHNLQVKHDKEVENRRKEFASRIKKLEEYKAKLEVFIQNDNNSVKFVNESKEELEEIKIELVNLKDKLQYLK